MTPHVPPELPEGLNKVERPETTVVAAVWPAGPGQPLNVPMVPVSTYALGADRA